MEMVFIGIEKPDTMTSDEAIRRAKNIVAWHTAVGEFHTEQDESGVLVGNLEVRDGFYDAHPDGWEGKDDQITVRMEVP